MRILLAEDDRELRELMARSLRRAGHEVETVADGDALWARGCEAVHDLLVTDHHMPGRTGLQALRDLRAAGWDTPALIVSSFVDELARLPEAVQVLAKPVDLLELKARIAELPR